MTKRGENNLILMLNGAGVAVAYLLLGISLYLSTDVPLATKGYWGMGIVLLTLSLINVVKYRFDGRSAEDRINRILFKALRRRLLIWKTNWRCASKPLTGLRRVSCSCVIRFRLPTAVSWISSRGQFRRVR